MTRIYDCPGQGCGVSIAIVSFDGRPHALVPCARCVRAERMTEASLRRVNARCVTCGGQMRSGEHATCANNESIQLRGAA